MRLPLTRLLAGPGVLAVLVIGACGIGAPTGGGSGPATDPPPVAEAAPLPEPAGSPVPVVPVAPAAPVAPPDSSGPTTAPVRIAVPAREIDVPVDPVGVAPDGQMEIPPLAERAGWYRFGADPGDEAGTTVLAAHVDSVASGGTGPFVRLAEALPGDEVQVALADGSVRTYVVDQVVRLPKTEVRWPDVFVLDGPPRLALVTCGGTFDRTTRHYRDNVLVTAVPQGA